MSTSHPALRLTWSLTLPRASAPTAESLRRPYHDEVATALTGDLHDAVTGATRLEQRLDVQALRFATRFGGPEHLRLTALHFVIEFCGECARLHRQACDHPLRRRTHPHDRHDEQTDVQSFRRVRRPASRPATNVPLRPSPREYTDRPRHLLEMKLYHSPHAKLEREMVTGLESQKGEYRTQRRIFSPLLYSVFPRHIPKHLQKPTRVR